MPQPQPTQDQIDSDSLNKIIRSMASPTTEDITFVKKTFAFAKRAHEGHLRHSGEPYFKHLSETAIILAELGARSVIRPPDLPHDTVEVVGEKRKKMEKELGKEVFFFVEGVPRLGL